MVVASWAAVAVSGEFAEFGVVDVVDDAGGFADFGVGESAVAEGGVDGGHAAEGAGDADVFAGGAGGHGAGPGQPVGEGFHAVPPADGVAGVELADQLQQLALRLRGEPGGSADLATERFRVRAVQLPRVGHVDHQPSPDPMSTGESTDRH